MNWSSILLATGSTCSRKPFDRLFATGLRNRYCQHASSSSRKCVAALHRHRRTGQHQELRAALPHWRLHFPSAASSTSDWVPVLRVVLTDVSMIFGGGASPSPKKMMPFLFWTAPINQHHCHSLRVCQSSVMRCCQRRDTAEHELEP